MLKPYVGETFVVATAAEKITYRLKKESKRWDGDQPHFRYTFDEIGREPVTKDDQDGLVLEEPTASSGGYVFPVDELNHFEPEELEESLDG